MSRASSDEPNETSVNLAYNQSRPWFDFIQADPVFAKRYNLAMKAHGGAAGYAVISAGEICLPYAGMLPPPGVPLLTWSMS